MTRDEYEDKQQERQIVALEKIAKALEQIAKEKAHAAIH
jgi:hypothetical protein